GATEAVPAEEDTAVGATEEAAAAATEENEDENAGAGETESVPAEEGTAVGATEEAAAAATEENEDEDAGAGATEAVPAEEDTAVGATEEAAVAATEENAAAAATEAVPAEEEGTAVAAMPAKTFRSSVAGMTISVRAEEGTFPEGTQIRTTYVSPDSVMEAIEGTVDGEIMKVKAVDISFRYEDHEIQPGKPVQVSISAPGMDSSLDHEIVHINDHKSGVVETVVNKEDMPGTKGSFEADGFSIYAIVESGSYNEDDNKGAVCTYEFYTSKAEAEAGTDPISVQRVKTGDVLQEMPAPALGSNEEFLGWVTLEGDEVEFGVVTVAEEKTVKAYAKKSVTYYVTYIGAAGEILAVERVEAAAGESGKAHPSRYVAVPAATEGAFYGWAEKENAGIDEVIENDPYFVTGNKELYPVIIPCFWIRFYENDGGGGGASYTEPVAVREGETAESVKPEDPTRPGYSFVKWTKDPEGTEDFDWDSYPDKNQDLYAQWEPNAETNYTIVVWKQKVTDSKNAEDEQKTYDYVESHVRSAAPDQEITEDLYVGSLTQYPGFKDKYRTEYDENTKANRNRIRGGGDTVINIYFDRKLETIQFNTLVNSEWTEYKTFTGLYGQTLQQGDPSYVWPDEISWYDFPSGPGGGCDDPTNLPTILAYFDEQADSTPELYELYGFEGTNYTVSYYKQNTDGTWPNEPADTVKIAENVRGFKLTEQYGEGFAVYQYRTLNNGNYAWGEWTNYIPGNTLFMASTSAMGVRFKRNRFDLSFSSDGSELEDLAQKEVYFEKPLGDYEPAGYIKGETTKKVDDVPYVFDGWYRNEAGAGDAFDFSTETMPAANLTLYAKWVKQHFHVSLDPDSGTFVNPQDVEFDVDFGEELDKESLEKIERAGYTLVGWYDENDKPYEYGRISGNLSLIAKWRRDGEVAIDYDASEHSTDVVQDTHKYSTDSTVVVARAPSNVDEGFAFIGWQINGTGKVYYPNNSFDIDKVDHDPDDPDKVVLAARYENTGGEGTATEQVTITYDPNGGKGGQYTIPPVYRNEEITIKDASDSELGYTRTSYEFIGWALEGNKNGSTPDFRAGDVVGADNVTRDYGGTTDGNPKANVLYALWRETQITINYAVASDSTGMGTVSKAQETLKAHSETASGSSAVPASDIYQLDFWTCDEGTDHISTDLHYVPSQNSDEVYEAHTYYAHFKRKEAAVTVHHYLRGTTTKVADDVTAAVGIGLEYTAGSAAEFYEKFQEMELIADSYAPNQKITVDADENNNEIFVYYTLALTIKAETRTREYDGQPLAGEYMITGALSDDESMIVEALGTPPSITNVSESPKKYLTKEEQAGITGIPGYYNVAYTPGTLTITKAGAGELGLVVRSYENEYDGSEHSITVDTAVTEGTELYFTTSNPGEAGFDVGSWSRDNPVFTHVGETPAKVYVKAENANYETASTDATVTISRKAVTIEVSDDSKTFGESDPEFEDAGITGGIGNDLSGISLKVSRSDVGDETVTTHEGVLAISQTKQQLESAYTDYSFTVGTGDFEIRPVKLSDNERIKVTEPGDVYYNGLEQKQEVTIKDSMLDDYELKENEDYTITYKDKNNGEDFTNAGEITIVVDGMGNYAETLSMTYKILPRPVNLKSESGSKPFDGEPLELPDVSGGDQDDENNTGFVTGEVTELKATGSVTQVSEKIVDNKITFTKTGNFRQENYSINIDEGELWITQREITVEVPDAADVEYDGKEHTGETQYKFSNLVEGHEATITYNPAKGTETGTHTGSFEDDLHVSYEGGCIYGCSATYDVTDNYMLVSMTPGKLFIFDTDISDGNKIKVSQPADVIYNGAEQKQNVTVQTIPGEGGETSTLTEGKDYELVYDEDLTSIGTKRIKVKGTGSCKGEVDREYQILPIGIAVKAKDSEKVYDGKALKAEDTGYELAIDTEGVVSLPAGEIMDVTLSGGRTLVGSTPAKIDGVTIRKADGTETTGNYTITTENGTLTVTDGTGAGEDPVDDSLVVTKTVDSREYKPGETVTFTVTATNIYDEAKDITLSEIDGVTLKDKTFSGVEPGETVETTASYRIKEADSLKGSFKNTVTAAVGNVTKKAEATVKTEEKNGHLTVEKTTTSETPGEGYAAGDTIGYGITVKNDGNLTITDITVTDELTGDRWTVASLAPGESKDYTTSYTVTEDDAEAGEVVNVATATGTSPDPEVPEVPVTPGTDPEPTTNKKGHLTVTKDTTSETPVGGYDFGDTIEYRITVLNDGNLTITDITVKDELTGDEWAVESLAPGESREFEASYTVKEADIMAGEVVNVATATGTSPDPGEPEVPVTPGTDSEPTADKKGHLTVTKDTTSETPEEGYALGDTIEYRITVLNDGNLTITDITVKDELTGDEWAVESLAPGESKDFTTSYTVTGADVAAGEVVNVATAAGTSPDPEVPDVPAQDGIDSEPVSEGIDPEPEPISDGKGHLTVEKVTTSEAPEGGYPVGATIEYKITVINDGDFTITGITVTDGLTGDEWEIASLASGESKEFTAKYTVTEADAEAGEVLNVATATGTSPDPDEPEVPAEDGTDTEPVAPAAPPTPVAPVSYDIRYNLNGGSYDGSTEDIVEQYPVGTVITIHEAPERDGYTFDYWKGSAYQPGDKYTVTGDHVFEAQWKEKEEE
ncbi:MAG: InlB B-repeat-containing protein, partial [Eubacteriales bacterium]|nr:InlB B-repeat-containing protein [Eubacteriales bacterium]